jgi:hypothetical protein
MRHARDANDLPRTTPARNVFTCQPKGTANTEAKAAVTGLKWWQPDLQILACESIEL